MKVTEMRELPLDELSARVTTWQEELFRARCDKTVGQLSDTTQVTKLRKDIARGLTLINEKRRNEKGEDA